MQLITPPTLILNGLDGGRISADAPTPSTTARRRGRPRSIDRGVAFHVVLHGGQLDLVREFRERHGLASDSEAIRQLLDAGIARMLRRRKGTI